MVFIEWVKHLEYEGLDLVYRRNLYALDVFFDCFNAVGDIIH